MLLTNELPGMIKLIKEVYFLSQNTKRDGESYPSLYRYLTVNSIIIFSEPFTSIKILFLHRNLIIEGQRPACNISNYKP